MFLLLGINKKVKRYDVYQNAINRINIFRKITVKRINPFPWPTRLFEMRKEIDQIQTGPYKRAKHLQFSVSFFVNSLFL